MNNTIQIILKPLKISFDRIGNDQFKNNLLQALPFWVASLITGLVAVLYAKLFGFAEKGTLYLITHHIKLFFIFSPLCFIVSWLLVKYFSPFARGSGIPQVMAAIELATPSNEEKANKLLNLRIIIIKIVSSLVMILGGGVIGREGPTIQIAASIFRKVNQILPHWWPKISRKNMIMAGAAAGLAAAFNTPLGGIVFAVEELSKTHISFFKTALFTAVIIAGLTAQSLIGPYLYLGYPDVSNLSPYIFFSVAGVACIGGLFGSSSSKLILAILNWKSKFKFTGQHLLYLCFASLTIVCFAYFVDIRVLGSGKELITHALFSDEKYLPWYMPFLRMGGSIICFTTGTAGGVFAPALSAGASIGSITANLTQISGTNANLLILSGMVAFLTGVTRTPFTASILVLEMTDRHNVIFHLMLAGLISSFVSLLIDKHSLYDHLKNQYIKEAEEENKST